MLQPVSRIVDLLDPGSEPHRQHERRGGPAARPRWRSRRRARHRRVVRAGGRRGRDRPARAVARSPDALLPGQAARGPGALRGRSDRHAACGARPRRPGGSVSPQLHADDPRPLRGRDRARRLSRSGPHLYAFLHAAGQRAARDARRDRPAVCRSDGARDREVAATGRSGRHPARAHRGRVLRAASTAVRSFSSPITR